MCDVSEYRTVTCKATKNILISNIMNYKAVRKYSEWISTYRKILNNINSLENTI